tara:strand:- start:186 stop:770 length:585 start_codon:yes stop_codon:yes gene_type:complete
MKINFVPKEDIINYPVIRFEGDIQIINNKKDMIKACSTLSNFSEIGFDTETKPSFKKGVIHNVCLLQLATTEIAYIFRLNKLGLSTHLIDILSNKSIVKIGIDIKNDIAALKKIKFFTESSFVDLNQLAIDKGFKSIGAVKLSIMLLGYRISKVHRLSDWESDNLSDSQINYAATDAWICLKIIESFKNKLLFP